MIYNVQYVWNRVVKILGIWNDVPSFVHIDAIIDYSAIWYYHMISARHASSYESLLKYIIHYIEKW